MGSHANVFPTAKRDQRRFVLELFQLLHPHLAVGLSELCGEVDSDQCCNREAQKSWEAGMYECGIDARKSNWSKWAYGDH